MSHFTVMVFTETDEISEVENQLQPFHEYECTGIEDEHVVWVDMHDEKLKEYEEEDEKTKAEYPTLKEYMTEYYGHNEEDYMKDGRWGRKTNPNSQWDWWVVGGRWSDFLLLRDGSRANQAQKKDIDFEGMVEANQKKREARFDEYIKILNGREYPSWEDHLKKGEEAGLDIDIIREKYRNHPVIQDFRNTETFKYWFGDIVKDFCYGDKQKYMSNAYYNAVGTYAAVKDQKWHSKGRMGWWGISMDEQSSWPETFEKLIKEADDDTWITIVDCHI